MSLVRDGFASTKLVDAAGGDFADIDSAGRIKAIDNIKAGLQGIFMALD